MDSRGLERELMHAAHGIDASNPPIVLSEISAHSPRIGRAPGLMSAPRMASLIVMLTLAAIVVSVVLISVGDGGTGDRVVGVASNGPQGILALQPGSKDLPSDLVEIDRATRRVTRVVAAGIGLKASLTTDGQVAIVSALATSPRICPDEARVAGGWVLFEIDLATGDRTVIGDGLSPRLSPDGSHLAYLSAGCTPAELKLVVRDLASRTERRWSLDDTAGVRTLTPVAWAPDSRHLVVEVAAATTVALRENDRAYRYLDTDSETTLSEAPRLKAPKGHDGPFDLYPLGSSGLWAAVVSDDTLQHPLEIIGYDPVTGRRVRSLVRRIPVDGQARNPGLLIDLLASDSSGRHLLFSVSPLGGVYEWSQGDQKPTNLPRTIYDAQWLP